MMSWDISKRVCYGLPCKRIRILAVATLKDVSAVLIVNGTSPDDETLQKGREEAVPLLGTTRSAFEASGMIYRLLQNENG